MNNDRGEVTNGLAVRALVKNKSGQWLMLKRSADSRNFPGIWEWPGGKTEAGESFDQALIREVAEETGFHIDLSEVIGAYQFRLDRMKIAVLCMGTDPVEGKPQLSEEHDAYTWIDPDEVFSLNISDWFRTFLEKIFPQREPES